MMRRGSWVVLRVLFAVFPIAAAGSCSAAITATPPEAKADGHLTAWQSAPNLLAARANHCSTVVKTADGAAWLVVVGGNAKPPGAKDFVTLDDVEVARIAADGSLGAWSHAGTAPSKVNTCTLTAGADGAGLLLVAGIYDDAAKSGHVWRADLDGAGALGAWRDVGALPPQTTVLSAPAYVKDGTLVTFHAKLVAEGDAVTILRAPLAGETVGAWSDDEIVQGFLGRSAYAFDGAHAYVLGGYVSASAGLQPIATTHVAAVAPRGPAATAIETTPLPTAIAGAVAVAVDGWVFVVGGKTEIVAGAGRAEVLSAPIEADGRLGAWAEREVMPQGRTSHAVAAYGNFLYVTGGGFDGPGLDSVYVARVRF
jgi:hypothetical protein